MLRVRVCPRMTLLLPLLEYRGLSSVNGKQETRLAHAQHRNMSNYIGNKFGQQDVDKLREFEKKANPNDKQQAALIDEMRAHIKKLEEMKKNEDPRLSFSTPEFKEAQRIFTDNFKKNFGKPVEWALVKDHAWSTAQLRKLDVPVDMEGKPWPLDAAGKPILKA